MLAGALIALFWCLVAMLGGMGALALILGMRSQ